MTWRSMAGGAPFNTLLAPAPEDISTDTGSFTATWSPGQYLVPIVFTRLGLTLGHALTVTASLCTVAALAGCFKLYRRMGFPVTITLTACAVLASTRATALPFGIYNGGEVLLFAATPWIILATLESSRVGWYGVPLGIALFLFGAFLKLSFAVSAVALLIAGIGLCLFGLGGWAEASWRGCALKASCVLVLFGAAMRAYTAKGWTAVASSLGGGWHLGDPVTSVAFASAAPFASALSIGDFLNRALRHPSNPVIASYDDARWFLAVAAVLAGVMLVWVVQTGTLQYRVVTISFFATYLAIFSFFWLTGAPVSMDDRHFRPVGLLLLPGIVGAVAMLPRAVRLVAWAGIAALCLYGVVSFGVRWEANRVLANVGRDGFTHAIASREVVTLLQEIDERFPSGTTLVYVPSPEMSLEVRHVRVMSSHADFEPLSDLSQRRYRGRVDNLFVVLQKSFDASGKRDAILTSFRDYERTRWEWMAAGSFSVYFQAKQTGLLELRVADSAAARACDDIGVSNAPQPHQPDATLPSGESRCAKTASICHSASSTGRLMNPAMSTSLKPCSSSHPSA